MNKYINLKMGNYNCQECITKEVNIINELLLDTNLLSPEEPPMEETKIHESKIKPKKNNKLKPNEEDLKKLIENKDLSEDQKKFLEKIINKNSIDLYLNNNIKQKEQKKIIEKHKKQIQSQQKIIQKYEQNQLNIEKNQNQNKEDNIPDVKITTLEPPKNIIQEKIPQDIINKNVNNEAIVIKNSPNSEEEINDIKYSNPQDENIKIEYKKDENENEDIQISKKYKNENNDIINDNNNMNNLFEKNDRENEPQDSIIEDFRKPIIPQRNNDNKNKMKIINKESGPRDNLRKNFYNKDNNINDNNKPKVPVNKYEINDYDINNNINKNNQKYLSPFNNELEIKDINNNNMIINENNYEEQRNAVTFGPYLNDIDEIKNAYTVGNVVENINNDNQNEIIYTQQISQKDMEMTISDKENPLYNGDDKGNMNYLEDKYEAYKNRMRYNYED